MRKSNLQNNLSERKRMIIESTTTIAFKAILVLLYTQLKAVFFWHPICFLEQVNTCKVVSMLAIKIVYLHVDAVRIFIAL